MSALLRSLLAASEKAARIAQLCRQEEALFSLLIEEKRGADKNKKFLQDFKTLADVLIQEVIKHDVGKEVAAWGRVLFVVRSIIRCCVEDWAGS